MNYIDFEHVSEAEVLRQLQNGEILALIYLYRTYREDLLIFTCIQRIDPDPANLLVDELFSELWRNWRFQDIDLPVYDFLFARMCTIADLYKGRNPG